MPSRADRKGKLHAEIKSYNVFFAGGAGPDPAGPPKVPAGPPAETAKPKARKAAPAMLKAKFGSPPRGGAQGRAACGSTKSRRERGELTNPAHVHAAEGSNGQARGASAPACG